MRPKLLIALFGVAAFFCAFFGATAVAKAAQSDEAVSVASASPAAHSNLAPPGSYAAKFGAPLCDDRAASAYAAEPRPAPVDSGEVAVAAAEEGCRTSVGALSWATSDTSPSQSDDLNRAPPAARDLAILPPTIDVPDVVMLVALLADDVADGARDGFCPRDNPPPRPIPWRS